MFTAFVFVFIRHSETVVYDVKGVSNLNVHSYQHGLYTQVTYTPLLVHFDHFTFERYVSGTFRTFCSFSVHSF